MPSIDLTTTEDYYRSSLNGCSYFHRNRWLLVQKKILTRNELQLYDLYVSITTWDQKKDTYGYFIVENKSIASLLNVSTKSIKKWHKTLLLKNFIRSTKIDHVFTLSNPDRYFGSKVLKASKQEKNIEIPELEKLMTLNISKSSIEVEINSDKSSSLQTKDNTKGLVSFKDDLSFIYESNLATDDIDWINENVES